VASRASRCCRVFPRGDVRDSHKAMLMCIRYSPSALPPWRRSLPPTSPVTRSLHCHKKQRQETYTARTTLTMWQNCRTRGAAANVFGRRNLTVNEAWALYHTRFPMLPKMRFPQVGSGVSAASTFYRCRRWHGGPRSDVRPP
jgi:hypothetical protein